MPWILCGAGVSGWPAQRLRDQRRGLGLHGHGQDRLALRLLDVAAHAGDRAAGADAGHEHVDASRRCRPRSPGPSSSRGSPGSPGSRTAACSTYRPGSAAASSSAFAIAPFMPERAGREHQLRAERDQHLAPLHAHRLGHREHALVAARRRGERERDAGVAAGRLDDRLAGPEHAALLRVPHHRRADAALHRVGRVAALDLREHGGVRALREVVDADERRAADRRGVVLEHPAHVEPPPPGDTRARQRAPVHAVGRLRVDASIRRPAGQQPRGRRGPGLSARTTRGATPRTAGPGSGPARARSSRARRAGSPRRRS